jgi:hypothetical protein
MCGDANGRGFAVRGFAVDLLVVPPALRRMKPQLRRPSSAHTPGITAAAMQIFTMSAGRNG